MVLIRRPGVLACLRLEACGRRWAALGIVLAGLHLGGCSESLFGAHQAGQRGDAGDGGSDGGNDGGNGVVGCTNPCNADVAADFDGTLHGAHGRWRYLDDHRDRTWTPMTVGTLVMTGADPGTRITTCKTSPGSPACSTLPGALLVSSPNKPSTSDPAIELTVADPQVLQLQLKVFVPPGAADQQILLYRNSREDALFTGPATAGILLSHTITLDALPRDRFLVAVASTTAGAIDVGVDLSTTATGAAFPASCQLAVSFASATGNTVNDLCGNTVFTHYIATTATPPRLGDGPFPEQGSAIDLGLGEYLARGVGGDPSLSLLDWSQDVTVQLWAKINGFVINSSAVLFSDLDLDFGRGIDISLTQSSLVKLDVQTCATTSPITVSDASSTYQNPDKWQFIRAVRAGGQVRVCVNGKLVASASAATCNAPSAWVPQLGQHADIQGANVNGTLDDVRVFTGALPCN